MAQSFAVAVAQYPIIADCIGGSSAAAAAEARAGRLGNDPSSSTQATAQAAAGANTNNGQVSFENLRSDPAAQWVDHRWWFEHRVTPVSYLAFC